MRKYICSVCSRETPREMLVVKKVLFTKMGSGAKTLRARVKLWLCPSCTRKDEDWLTEPYQAVDEKKEAISG